MIKRRIAAAAVGLALALGALAATSSTTDDISANGLKFSIGQSASQDSGSKANGSRVNSLANGL